MRTLPDFELRLLLSARPVLGLALFLSAAAHALPVTLQNDGLDAGDAATYQSGFVTGEMAASRFAVTCAPTCQLLSVSFLYGPSATTNAIILHVYDDDAGTDAPGTQLYTDSFQVTGSPNAFTLIDLSTSNVTVPGAFRVAVEFTADGDPAAASDTDGTIAADENFIFTPNPGWVRSASLGLTGDWVIRASVDLGAVDAGSDAGTGTDAGVPDAGASHDAGTAADAGTGGTTPPKGCSCEAGTGLTPALAFSLLGLALSRWRRRRRP